MKLKISEITILGFSGGRYFSILLCLRSPSWEKTEKRDFSAALFQGLKSRKVVNSVKSYFCLFFIKVRPIIA
jgi:hypothetical protein